MKNQIKIIFLLAILALGFARTSLALFDLPPKGNLDVANCDTISGWAFDPNDSGKSIYVHIYRDGYAGQGVIVSAIVASDERSDVNSALGIPGNHGFHINTPDELKDGQMHTIWAHAIDNEGNDQLNPILSGSPIEINCGQPVSEPTPAPETTPQSTPEPGPTPSMTNDAKFISQNIPQSVEAGANFDVSITMLNSGTTTWEAGTGYKLGSQDPSDNSTWRGNRVLLPNSVAPGQQVTFNFTSKAPSTPGAYNFQWGMLQENVMWFGEFSSSVTINVTSQEVEPTPTPVATSTPAPTISPPVNSSKIDGYLDVANCDTIAGWAADTNNPSDQVSVELVKDNSYQNGGTIVDTRPTDVLRADVNQALHISGIHGFSWATPESLKDGSSHQLFVYATNGDGKYTLLKLNGPILTVQCGGATPLPTTPVPTSVPAVPSATPVPGPVSTPTPAPVATPVVLLPIPAAALVSNFDTANCDTISGWAFNAKDPSSPTTLAIAKAEQLFGKGTPIMNFMTTDLRSDVNARFNITGNHGFNISTPDSLKDGNNWYVFAYALDTHGTYKAVSGSPKMIKCGSTPPTVNPGSPTPSSIVGFLDVVNCDTIAGWAYDKLNPTNPVSITITRAGGTTTGVLRPDVNTTFNITGNHGFSISTPATLKDGISRSVSVYAFNPVGSNESRQLGNSPQTLTCGSPAPPPPDIPISGYFDGATPDGNFISGWVYNPTTYPLGPVVVTVDNNWGFSVDPNRYRPDVNAALGITGNHGFKLAISSIPDYQGKFRDGKSHKLHAQALISAPVSTTGYDLGTVTLSANTIASAQAPDPHKYDAVIQDLANDTSDLDSVLEKAINAGLIVVDEGDNMFVIYNPDIADQPLLTVSQESELKTGPAFSKIYAKCNVGDSERNRMKMLFGKSVGLPGGPVEVHVNCGSDAGLCARIKQNLDGTFNKLNDFMQPLGDVPMFFVTDSYHAETKSMVSVMLINEPAHDGLLESANARLTSSITGEFNRGILSINTAWILNPNVASNEIQITFIHELLHLLGFDHATIDGVLMSRIYTPDVKLSSDIASLLRFMYGNETKQLSDIFCEAAKKDSGGQNLTTSPTPDTGVPGVISGPFYPGIPGSDIPMSPHVEVRWFVTDPSGGMCGPGTTEPTCGGEGG